MIKEMPCAFPGAVCSAQRTVPEDHPHLDGPTAAPHFFYLEYFTTNPSGRRRAVGLTGAEGGWAGTLPRGLQGKAFSLSCFSPWTENSSKSALLPSGPCPVPTAEAGPGQLQGGPGELCHRMFAFPGGGQGQGRKPGAATFRLTLGR